MTKPLKQQIKDYERKLKKIASKEIPKASSSALNKVVAKARTKVVREVAAATKVKSKLIRKKVFVRRSNPRTQKAVVTVYADDIAAVSLISTRTLLNKARRGTSRKGVRVAGKMYQGAFINVVRKTGRFQVLQRRGRTRYPVDVVKIPIRDEVKRVALPTIERVRAAEYANLYATDLNFRLNKYGPRT